MILALLSNAILELSRGAQFTHLEFFPIPAGKDLSSISTLYMPLSNAGPNRRSSINTGGSTTTTNNNNNNFTLNLPEVFSDSRGHGYKGPTRHVRFPRATASGGGSIAKSDDGIRCVVAGRECEYPVASSRREAMSIPPLASAE